MILITNQIKFAERFIRTLKNKIYKCRFQYQKCVY